MWKVKSAVFQATIRGNTKNGSFHTIFSQDVKDSIGDDVQVAEQFILYIQESIPTAIFVVTFDPVLKYSVRRLFEDGDSTAIYFFKENDASKFVIFDNKQNINAKRKRIYRYAQGSLH